MQNVAIYGGGGLGREIAAMMGKVNAKQPQWNLVGFFDDGLTKGDDVSHFGKVLGGVDEVNAWAEPLGVIITVGAPQVRKAIREKINNPRIAFPNFIYSNFYVADEETFRIGEGNVITGGCVVTVNVSLGNFNLLNGNVTLGHDVKTGDYNVFMPDVRISGEVVIGDCNQFGVGSIVLQQLRIGSHVKLGAGSVMMTKPRDGRTYIGVPAKKFDF